MKIRTNKTIIMLAASLSAIAILSACDDEITKIAGPDVQTVAAYKDLAECSGKNEGDLYYVKDSGAVYLCSDSVWKATSASLNSTETKNGTDGKNGADGKDGKNGSDGKDGSDGKNGTDGKDGASCTVSALKDSSGYDIICDGKKVGTLLNGKNGAKGDKGDNGVKGDDGAKGDNGKNGTTCSAKELSDGSGYELSCDGKIVGTIKNGTKGEKGDDGTACTSKALEDGSGYELSCGGKVVGTVKNGTTTNAECIFDYDNDGTVTIKCGDKDAFKLPLALCGTTPYDPDKKECFEGELSDKLENFENLENLIVP